MNESISLAKRLASVFISDTSDAANDNATLTNQSTENIAVGDTVVVEGVKTEVAFDWTEEIHVYEHLVSLLALDDGECVIELGNDADGASFGYTDADFERIQTMIHSQATKLNVSMYVE